MALVTLVSASGSPGVTTTALGLALRWRRAALLVDADPVGGSAVLAGYLQGSVAHNDAMVRLVLALRERRLAEELTRAAMPLPGGKAALLPGPRSHAQAGSLVELWPDLVGELRALDGHGPDVIIDAGRAGMRHSPIPLVNAADLLLVVCRSDLPALAAARQWVGQWSLSSREGSGPTDLGVLLIGEGHPYGARETEKVLGAPVLETIRWDPVGAGVLSRGERSRRQRGCQVGGSLWRDLSVVAAAIDAQVVASRSTVGTVAP